MVAKGNENKGNEGRSYTYSGPKARAVDRFTRRNILGGGDIERVVLLFAFRTLEFDFSVLFYGSEIDRRTYCCCCSQSYGCWQLVVWHDCLLREGWGDFSRLLGYLWGRRLRVKGSVLESICGSNPPHGNEYESGASGRAVERVRSADPPRLCLVTLTLSSPMR